MYVYVWLHAIEKRSKVVSERYHFCHDIPTNVKVRFQMSQFACARSR